MIGSPAEVGAFKAALLPPGMAILPDVDLAAGAAGRDVRGDWFDAVPLGPGRAAVVVGSVPGESLTTLATAAQLRALLVDALRRTDDPGLALESLEASAGQLSGAPATSVVVAVLDSGAGTVEYCTAGHPSPMVVPAAGGAEHLPATGGGLIGSGVGFPVRSQRLAEGDVVVVHSAGAVDHPGSPRSEGSHELALLASRVGVGRSDVPDHPPVDRLVRTLPDQVRTARHPAGETIVLAGQLLPRPLAPLELDLPASDATAATVRTALAGWLDRLRLTSMDATALQHAVGELVSNSVRHAYRSAPSPGRVRTRAEIGDDGAIQVDVGDDGQWWDSGAVLPTVAGGRGLSLARLLTDDLKVSAAASGTTVSVRLRALRPVTTYDVGAEPEGIVTLHPYRAEEGDASIRVSGHVDAESADELRHALGRATRGTTSGLVVDLTGVTVLEGAGVQVLLEFWRGCRDNGHELELRADAGSVAHDVLATAQLL